MKRIVEIVAQGLSILLYPLWMPTYGIALASVSFMQRGASLSAVYWFIAIAGTFVLTGVIPLSIILVQRRRGEVSSLYIERREERTMPYIYAAMSFGFWTFFVGRTIAMPAVMTWIAGGATAAIAIVAVINRWWKISAHMTAMGGLLGGIAAFSLYIGAVPSASFVYVMLGLTLLLMYARLYVRAHTSLQVVAGLLLGLVATAGPYMIFSYVQTH